MIEFSCPSCGRTYRVRDELAGKTGRCKECGAAMPIPGEDIPVAEAIEEAKAPPARRPTSAPPPAARRAEPERRRRRPKKQAGSPRPATAEPLRGSTEHFDYQISQRPDFALVTLELPQGQKVFAEPSAMVSMTPSVSLKAGFKGGLGRTIGRALGGESLIINTFTAETDDGEVSFAPGIAGDTAHYELTGGTLYLQRGAFMLHSEGVDVSGKWQGAKGFFGGQGLVLLKASGVGDIFFNSYGAILSVNVADEYIVDTGYIVAFEDTLDYRVSTLPGLRSGGKLKTLFFGGEGLVCRFSGQGRVWIQTRHVQSFLSWVNPFRPVKSRN